MRALTCVTVALGIVLSVCSVPCVEARSAAYFDTVNDILQGINYYSLLDVDVSATQKEIKRAHRLLAIKYHPDKNPSAEARAQFLLIQRAVDILTEEETRKEYDFLLENGVPMADRYYNRHMHRMGVPQHDPFWVLFWAITLSTAVHWWNRWMTHWNIHRRVKETNVYRTLRNQNAESQGLSPKELKKLAKKGKLAEDKAQEIEPEINIKGAERPTLWDLLPILIVRNIYSLAKDILFWIDLRLIKRIPPPTQEEIMRKQVEDHVGRTLTDEEYQVELDKIKARWERKMQSGKVKRYLRWMKKNS